MKTIPTRKSQKWLQNIVISLINSDLQGKKCVNRVTKYDNFIKNRAYVYLHTCYLNIILRINYVHLPNCNSKMIPWELMLCIFFEDILFCSCKENTKVKHLIY